MIGSGLVQSCLVVTASRTASIWWPQKLPGSTVVQTFDTTLLPDPIYPSQIQALTAQIAPSGEGEMQGVTLDLSGSIVSLLETGGQAGRVYTILFTITLADGEDVQWIINQAVSCIPPPNPIPPPPVPGFGTEIIWMPIPLVASGLVATGTTQGTANAIGAFTNVFATVLTGAGVILPTFIINGSVKLINEGANVMSVWPPVGAQINAFGANTAVGINPGGAAVFSTSAPLAQWTQS